MRSERSRAEDLVEIAGLHVAVHDRQDDGVHRGHARRRDDARHRGRRPGGVQYAYDDREEDPEDNSDDER